jgi:phosphatidylglycerophosphate synthase
MNSYRSFSINYFSSYASSAAFRAWFLPMAWSEIKPFYRLVAFSLIVTLKCVAASLAAPSIE